MRKILQWCAVLVLLLCLALAACDSDVSDSGGAVDTSVQTGHETEQGVSAPTETEAETEPHVHAFGDWTTVKEATCTEAGEQKRTCECGEIEMQSINAFGHAEVVDAAIEPTCTETGLTAGKHCSVCNEVLIAQEIINANGHEYTCEVITEPTCTEVGKQVFTCTVCSDNYTEDVPSLGHTEVVDAAVAPACTETGLTEGKHCSVCDEVFVAQKTLPALGHTKVTDVAIDPTCTTVGMTEGVHCSVCYVVFVAQQQIPALGHVEVIDQALVPTCTSTGLTEGKHCSRCKSTLVVQEIVEKLPHTLGDWVIDKQATCAEEGSRYQVCTVCTQTVHTESIGKLEHTRGESVTENYIAPRCADDGFYDEVVYCTECNAELSREEKILPALGHDFNTRDVERTNSRSGYTEVTCKNCTFIEYRNIKPAINMISEAGCITTKSLSGLKSLIRNYGEMKSSTSLGQYYEWSYITNAANSQYRARYIISDGHIELSQYEGSTGKLFMFTMYLYSASGSYTWQLYQGGNQMKGTVNAASFTTYQETMPYSSSNVPESARDIFNQIATLQLQMLLLNTERLMDKGSYDMSVLGFNHFGSGSSATHNYSVTSYQVATCSAEGRLDFKCDTCGKTRSETVAKSEHTYQEVDGDPGYHSYLCTACEHLCKELISYAISYELNGGSAEHNVTKYDVETQTFTLNNPTRTGYTFIGWTGADLSEPTLEVIIPLGSTGDREYTACWEANQYTITYDANLGTVSKQNDTVIFASDYVLAKPERVGYTFVGWYSNEKKIEDGVWLIDSDIILVARWEANTDTPYKVNHYFENVDNDEYTLVETDILAGMSDTEITPAVRGVVGFTSPEEQTVTIAPDGSLIVDYYYSRNHYTISFVTNSGSTIDSITQKYQSELTMPIVIRTDYTFGGWFSDVGLTKEVLDTTMPAQDMTVYAWWSEENKPCDFLYNVTTLSNGTTEMTITGYQGYSEMWIPTYIGDILVTQIADAAFENQTNIGKVVVPDSVTSIGLGAFKGCTSIAEITIPFVGAQQSGVNNRHFGYIFGATEYNIHFGKLGALKKIVVTGGNIADYAFFTLSAWGVSVELREGVTSIDNYAFQWCDGLERISIPSSCKKIGHGAFYECKYLTDVIIADGVTMIDEWAFYGCRYLKNITSLNSVETIGVRAFQGCKNLTSISISDSLTSVGDTAFYDCWSLTDVYYTGTEENWNSISIGRSNSYLTDATIHYNYVKE